MGEKIDAVKARGNQIVNVSKKAIKVGTWVAVAGLSLGAGTKAVKVGFSK